MNIKELVKDNVVKFVRFKNGEFIYRIEYAKGSFEFPVPLKDLGDAELLAQDKAILFMRYIRKHMENLY